MAHSSEHQICGGKSMRLMLITLQCIVHGQSELLSTFHVQTFGLLCSKMHGHLLC